MRYEPVPSSPQLSHTTDYQTLELHEYRESRDQEEDGRSLFTGNFLACSRYDRRITV